MSGFSMELLDDLVAVLLDEPETGRVRLPDWQRSLSGRVIGVGPGRPLENGTRAPMSVAEKDKVSFGAAVGMESMYNGHRIRVMRDKDIDMVLG